MINREYVEEKLQKAIENTIIKSEEVLMDIPLDELEEIANKIDVCPKELIIYLTCGGDCKNCDIC